jgi:glycosyltransferase involved in cell wall biosynthesis
MVSGFSLIEKDFNVSPLSVTHVCVSKELGGGERVAIDMACAFKRNYSWNTHMFAPSGGSTLAECRANEINTKSYSTSRLFSKSNFFSGLEAFSVRSRIPIGNSIVHIHAPFVYGALSRFLSVPKGLSTVVHVHLDYVGPIWGFDRPPKKIVLCAEFLRAGVLKSLPENLKGSVRIYTLRNFVDTERFAPLDRMFRATHYSVDFPFVVSIIANLAPHKGHHTAIMAISKLVERGLPVKLLIVGSDRDVAGRYEKDLRELVFLHGINANVEFLGQRNDIPEILRSSDVFLLPSTIEGLPLSILEAQSSGVVVIAAPTAGIPEIVKDEVSGLLVNADDVKGYADAIERVYRDRELFASLRNGAIDSIRSSHRRDLYMRKLRDIYLE